MTTLDSKTAPTIADHEAEQIDRANATGLTPIVVDASHSIALSQPTAVAELSAPPSTRHPTFRVPSSRSSLSG